MDKLKFSEHICIVGKTGSGMSRLLGEILSRNVALYDRKTSENIAAVVSPHRSCEINQYVTSGGWDIRHFCMSKFDEVGASRVISYLEDRGDLGKEIMLLLDDIAFRAQFSSKAAEVLVGLYATLRHQNISVVSTLQLHNPNFYDLKSNKGYVIVMNALGQRKILCNILRYYIQAREVPDLVDEVCSRFGGSGCGDYIRICLSPRANENKMYTIVNNVFDPVEGLRRKELEL